MQSTLSAIYVDEFHDFDALQADLLMRLVPTDKTFVGVGSRPQHLRFPGFGSAGDRDLLNVAVDGSGPRARGVLGREDHRGSAQSLAIAAGVLAPRRSWASESDRDEAAPSAGWGRGGCRFAR